MGRDDGYDDETADRARKKRGYSSEIYKVTIGRGTARWINLEHCQIYMCTMLQACIDDNLDMVEFLVEHGADINKGDNEGWTPLHATASCGFISIAK